MESGTSLPAKSRHLRATILNWISARIISAAVLCSVLLSASWGADPNLPPDLLPLAREAKQHFENKDYLEAEKVYRKILTQAPTNLYTLSNLGVVLFRAGKLKASEKALKEAIAVAPEDAFSHTTLGIVYYSQGKYDEAIQELTKSLALNPKNATAHSYLGNAASQKGWSEAARKEWETAAALDPSYADAYRNMGVLGDFLTPLEMERLQNPKTDLSPNGPARAR